MVSHTETGSDSPIGSDRDRGRDTVKSSMKISITSSARSENIDIMHLWKVPGALHKPNGILQKAKVPNGHVKVVFS